MNTTTTTISHFTVIKNLVEERKREEVVTDPKMNQNKGSSSRNDSLVIKGKPSEASTRRNRPSKARLKLEIESPKKREKMAITKKVLI